VSTAKSLKRGGHSRGWPLAKRGPDPRQKNSKWVRHKDQGLPEMLSTENKSGHWPRKNLSVEKLKGGDF